MDANDTLPALRPIEIMPFRKDGQVYFALQDPTQLAPQSIAISAAGYFVLAHLDGAHRCADIQAAARAQAGLELAQPDILKLVHALDEALFLHGPRAEEAQAARRAAYSAGATRDNRRRYGSADELRAEIERIVAGGSAAPVKRVRGLIAPHLDYARGRPCYADAYATLAHAEPAERYVLLGTNHFGESACAVATTKDFHTPFGAVRTDRAFIAQLEDRVGAPLCTYESDHLLEHSIELQLHILQVLAGDRTFEIVPILCPDVCGATGTRPTTGYGPDLRALAKTVGELITPSEARTIVIAGADLSHVGQRFHDAEPTTPQFLAAVAESDRELLLLLQAREEEQFVARIAASGNPTRICSAGCILALLSALPERPCRVLSYHQAVDMAAETHVTCAAAVVS